MDFRDGKVIPVECDFGETGHKRADDDSGNLLLAQILGEASRVVVVFADRERLELIAQQFSLPTRASENFFEVRRSAVR